MVYSLLRGGGFILKFMNVNQNIHILVALFLLTLTTNIALAATGGPITTVPGVAANAVPGTSTNNPVMIPSGIPGGAGTIPEVQVGGILESPAIDPATGFPIGGGGAPASTNMPQPEIQTVITAEMMQEAMRIFINEAKLIRQEAEAGNSRQQHNVAVLYTLGLGVPLDHKTAFEWFNKAAEDGIPESQFNVAIALQGGLGTQKDLVTSYKFYILAAAQGLPNSADARDHLAQYLNREQIEAGQRMARGFLTKLERKRYYENRREIESKKMEAIRKGLNLNNIAPLNTDN